MVHNLDLMSQHSMASMMWFFATMQYDPGAVVTAAVIDRMLDMDRAVCRCAIRASWGLLLGKKTYSKDGAHTVTRRTPSFFFLFVPFPLDTSPTTAYAQKLPEGSTLAHAGVQSPRPFAQLLWSLARLGRYPGAEVVSAAQAAILQRSRRCSGRAVGNILYALAVFDALTLEVLLAAASVLWEQLQEEAREEGEGGELWDSQLFLYMQV